MAFAVAVPAGTIDVRHLFHCLALDAAVFARSCQAGTNGVCALLWFRGFHGFSPGFGSREHDPGCYLRLWKNPFLYTMAQVANLTHSAGTDEERSMTRSIVLKLAVGGH